MRTRKQLPLAGLAIVCAAALAACGDQTLLPPATRSIVDDTVTLWALSGTDVTKASAFDILNQLVARTDRTTELDFAFDFRWDSASRDTVPVLVPRGAMGLSDEAGLIRVRALFDTLLLAPAEGYETHSPVPVDTGWVVFAHSRYKVCDWGIQSGLYAKIKPVAVDRANRAIHLRIAVDPNCGYRGLGPGVPTK